MIDLTRAQRFIKRTFDLVVSVIGLLLFGWLILLAWFAASIDTKSNGFFIQTRVGRYGKHFKVIKIKTMRPDTRFQTTVTTAKDTRITTLGSLFRKTKIDELPQLINVLKGDMSIVGPRPDVPGYADQLSGDEKSILNLRPGITGPATLKYRNEEKILAEQKEPEKYNDEVIFPDKVKINMNYMKNWSLSSDIRYIISTIIH